MTDSSKFGVALNTAKSSYNRTGEVDGYLGSTLKIALQMLAEENGHNKATTILSASSPIFSAIIDYGRDGFECPVENRHSASDFLHGLNEHIKSRLRRDYYRPAEKHLPEGASKALAALINLA